MAGTMNRRSFLKVSGGASAGLAGILASGRAPAYAQGQKLHMVRWVDFVPAADEALKKQAVEAGKALGAEITVETINANDIQPRITAAISSGSGAESSSSSTTSRISTRRASSTSVTSSTSSGRSRAATIRPPRAWPRSTASGAPRPTSSSAE